MINCLIVEVFPTSQSGYNILKFFDVRDAHMVNFLVNHPNGKSMIRHLRRNVMRDDADKYASDLDLKIAKLIQFYKEVIKEIDYDIASLKQSSDNLKIIHTEVFKRLSNQNNVYLANTRGVMLKIMKAELRKSLKSYIADLQKLKIIIEGKENNVMNYAQMEYLSDVSNKNIDELINKNYFELIHNIK